MKRKMAILGIILLSTLLTFGFFGKPKNAIATIEREVITKEDLNERINTFTEEQKKLITDQNKSAEILEQMIDETVLYVEAKKQGYEKNDYEL